MKPVRLLTLIVSIGAAALLATPRVEASTNIWFAPGGTGDGTAPDRPRSFDSHFVLWGLLHRISGLDHDVRMNFFPGEYLTDPIDTVTTDPSDWRISMKGLGRNPEDVVLKLKPNVPKGASEVGGDWVDVIDLGRNREYLRRFVLENMTIDGNWTGQTNFNNASYLRGYKNSPVYASARTGRIRRVIVRNYGAHGLLPQRPNDLSSGVEVFPIRIFTKDEGQQPEDGDPRPWVIEDCEVTDFHQYYNGYTTCLMASLQINASDTPRWASDDDARRLIWFRRNQVRGVPAGVGVIGQGVAGHGTNIAGRVTWSDNVVLNGAVYNTDTGSLSHLDITNCIGLDVTAVGYVGTAYSKTPTMTDYTITGNSVRFGWAFTWPDYRDHVWTNKASGGLGARTDRRLRLGRPNTPLVAGLMFQGIAKDIQFTGNWFTTRAREDFGGHNPIKKRVPVYRLVYRLPSRDPETPDGPQIGRLDAINVDLRDNRISSMAFDFEDMKLLPGNRVPLLSEKSAPLLDLRDALPAGRGFLPMGALHRVEMVYTNITRRIAWKGVPVGVPNSNPQDGASDGPDRMLMGAVEVVCGVPAPAAAGGKFRLPVRVALQPTPMFGGSGTQPLEGRKVFLEVLPGSKHPQKLSAQTDANGIANFQYTVSEKDGVDYFRVWTDGGNGRNGEWDEYQDAWSTAHFTHGRTIAVRIDSDVADTENGGRGSLRLLRSGSDDRAITVKLELADGASGGQRGKSYRLLAPPQKGSSDRRPDPAAEILDTVEFASGQREATVQVEALQGKAKSGDLVTLRIVPGDGYATGEPPEGTVVLYVPPK